MQNKLQQLYRRQDTIPKLIDDASVPTQKLDNYYVKLNILLDKKNGGEKVPIEVENMFSQIDEKPAPSRILVVGGAGIGKTVFLQNISYKWAKGEMYGDLFEFVFKVRLKLLTTAWQQPSVALEGGTANCLTWKDLYSTEQQADPLKCFIDYSLRQDVALSGSFVESIDTQEVFDALSESNQDKVLLLLDGYDEIANLVNRPGVVRDIINRIFTFKHVLMTSRPNALNSVMENRFDRKIESTGLSNEGVAEYIKKYFANQGEFLIEKIGAVVPNLQTTAADNARSAVLEHFSLSTEEEDDEIYQQLGRIFNSLDNIEVTSKSSKSENSSVAGLEMPLRSYYERKQKLISGLLFQSKQLREIAAIPINSAMICLICSDDEVMEKFQNSFSIGQLYHEVVVWLGKRLLLKQGKGEGNFVDLSDRMIEDSKELETLRQVAFNGFKENLMVLPGEFIDRVAQDVVKNRRENNNNHFGIRQVNQYGLLKIDNNGTSKAADDLIGKQHTFVHLSFQEYLAAYQLKENLLSDDSKIYQIASKFISVHRNEPKYLLLFKFLAGLVASDSSSQTKFLTSENAEKHKLLTKRFWEAITCNIDDRIELGLESKVILFMHLLAQAKAEEIEDGKKIKGLVDVVVTRDVTRFVDSILASGYVSNNIIEAILAILSGNFDWMLPYSPELGLTEVEFSLIAANERKIAIDFTTISAEEYYDYEVQHSSIKRIKIEQCLHLTCHLIKMGLFQASKISFLPQDVNITPAYLQNYFFQKILEIAKHPSVRLKATVIKTIEELLSDTVSLPVYFVKELMQVLQWYYFDYDYGEAISQLWKQMIASLPEEEQKQIQDYCQSLVINQMIVLERDLIHDILLSSHSLPASFVNAGITIDVVSLLQSEFLPLKFLGIKHIRELIDLHEQYLTQNIVKRLTTTAAIEDLSLLSQTFSKYAWETISLIAAKRVDLFTYGMLLDLFLTTSQLSTRYESLILVTLLEAVDQDSLPLLHQDIAAILTTLIVDFRRADDVFLISLLPVIKMNASLLSERAWLVIIESQIPHKELTAMLSILEAHPEYFTTESVMKMTKRLEDGNIVLTIEFTELLLKIFHLATLPFNSTQFIESVIFQNFKDYWLPLIIGICVQLPDTWKQNNFPGTLKEISETQADLTKSIELLQNLSLDEIYQRLQDTTLIDFDLFVTLVAFNGKVTTKDLQKIRTESLLTIMLQLIERKELAAAIHSQIYRFLQQILQQLPPSEWGVFERQLVWKLICESRSNNKKEEETIYKFLLFKELLNQRPDLFSSTELTEMIGFENQSSFTNLIFAEMLRNSSSLLQFIPENSWPIYLQHRENDDKALECFVLNLLKDPSKIQQTISVEILKQLIAPFFQKGNFEYLTALGGRLILFQTLPPSDSVDLSNTTQVISKLIDYFSSQLEERVPDLDPTKKSILLSVFKLPHQERFAFIETEKLEIVSTAKSHETSYEWVLQNNISTCYPSLIAEEVFIKIQSDLIESDSFLKNDKDRDNKLNILLSVAQHRPSLLSPKLFDTLLSSDMALASKGSDYPLRLMIIILAKNTNQIDKIKIIQFVEWFVQVIILHDNAKYVLELAQEFANLLLQIEIKGLIDEEIIKLIVTAFQSEQIAESRQISIFLKWFQSLALAQGEQLWILTQFSTPIESTSLEPVMKETLINLSFKDLNLFLLLIQYRPDVSVELQLEILVFILFEEEEWKNLGQMNVSQLKTHTVLKQFSNLITAHPNLLTQEILLKIVTVAERPDSIDMKRPLLDLLNARSDLVPWDSIWEKMLSSKWVDHGFTSQLLEILYNVNRSYLTSEKIERIGETLFPANSLLSLFSEEKGEKGKMIFSSKREIGCCFGILLKFDPQNTKKQQISVAIESLILSQNISNKLFEAEVPTIVEILDTNANLYDLSPLLLRFNQKEHHIEFSRSIYIFRYVYDTKSKLLTSELHQTGLTLFFQQMEDIRKASKLEKLHIYKLIECFLKYQPLSLYNFITMDLFKEFTSVSNDLTSELLKLHPEFCTTEMIDSFIKSNDYSLMIECFFQAPRVFSSVLDSPKKDSRQCIIQLLLLSYSLLKTRNAIDGEVGQKLFEVPLLLDLIGYFDPKDEEKKELLDTVKKILFDKIPFIEEEELAQITNHYDEIMTLSCESYHFLNKLFVQVLSDGKITSTEKEFINKSIANGMSVLFTHTFSQMIFDGVTYEVHDEESKEYIEQIIQFSLQQEKDILVQQYLTYQPLFTNREYAIPRAASDTPGITSLLDRDRLLSYNSSIVSLVFASDHNYSIPSAVFLFIENRNYFGHYHLQKLVIEQNASSHGLQSVKNYLEETIHPSICMDHLQNKDHHHKLCHQIEIIFGKMEYDLKNNIKPRCLITTFSFETQFLQKSLEEVVKKGVIEVQDDIITFYNQLLAHTKEAYQVSPVWAEYLRQTKTKEYRKEEIFPLNEDERNRVRSNSAQINTTTNVQEIKARVTKLEYTLEDVTTKMKGINFDLLSGMVKKEQLSQEIEQQIERIKKDPYQFAFYRSLMWQLNAVYAATQTLSTDMVEANNNDSQGTLGTLLQAASSHIPVVGLGVNIIGQVLEGVGQALSEEEQTKHFNHFSHIALSSQEMNEISEAIARRLTLAQLKVSTDKEKKTSEEKLDVYGTEICKNLSNAATTILQSSARDSLQKGMVTLIKRSILTCREKYHALQEQSEAGDKANGLVDYFHRFITIDPTKIREKDPPFQGETNSGIVVNGIIHDIYQGKYSSFEGTDRKGLVDAIVRDTIEKFDGVKPTESKVTATIEMKDSEEEDHAASPKSPAIPPVTETTANEEASMNSKRDNLSQRDSIRKSATLERRSSLARMSSYSTISKETTRGRFINARTLDLLKESDLMPIIYEVSHEEFKQMQYSLPIAIDLLKEIADVFFHGKHNIARGEKLITSFTGKINLTKELTAEGKSKDDTISGAIILKTMVKCQMGGAIDLPGYASNLNHLLELEQSLRYGSPMSPALADYYYPKK